MTLTPNSEYPDPSGSYRRRKRAWLWAIVATGFVSGICIAYFGLRRHPDPFAAPLIAVYLFLIFGWYHTDSDQRGFRRGFGTNFLIVATAIIGLPIYLFRTRGFTRGLLAVVLMLLMVLAFFVAAMFGAFSVALLFGVPTR